MESQHSLSEHQYRLNTLCRLCGERTKRGKDVRTKLVVLCTEFSSVLLENNIIDTSSDVDNTLSKQICTKCYTLMKTARLHRVSQTQAKSLSARVEFTSTIWTTFDSSISLEACNSCSHFDKTSKGGRPQKPKRGNPNLKKRQVPQEIDGMVFSPALCSTPMQKRKTADSTTSPIVPVLTNDTQTSPISFLGTTPSTSTVDVGTSPFTHSQALGLKVRHVDDIQGPLSKDEEKLATHFNRIKMKESSDGLVKYRTGGQPLVFMRVVKARKGSATATARTIKSRARLADRFCKIASGNTLQDYIRQKSAELKRTNKHQKSLILKSACCVPVQLSKKQLLALRIKLSLSGAKHKVIRKFLRASGVTLPSTSEEKQEQQAALSGEIHVQNKNLLFRDENDCKALKEAEIPVACVKDIPSFVSSLLDKNAQTGRLTWHGGAIPEGEIWVKIGADHGGGSF